MNTTKPTEPPRAASDPLDPTLRLEVRPEWEQIEQVREQSARFLHERGFPEDTVHAVSMVSAELTENAVDYGRYERPEQRIEVRVEAARAAIPVEVRSPVGAADDGHLAKLDRMVHYLTAPVAKTVLAKLYALLEPGGRLLVGNFHVRIPTRIYMEYWMDWALLYRSDQDMLDLAEGLPGAHAAVFCEATASQVFLDVRKPHA